VHDLGVLLLEGDEAESRKRKYVNTEPVQKIYNVNFLK
jgi:hypothetical protein